MRPRPLRRLLLALGLLLGACGGADVEQVELCARLIPALDQGGIEVLRQASRGRAVTVHYRATAPGGRTSAHWITCRFAGKGLQRDRLRLIEIETDREGELSAIQLYMLREFWLGRYEPLEGAEETPQATVLPAAPIPGELLYALQLALHAATLGCLYGLVAIGYTLVYGIIGRINLAFGEIAMVGAYATFLGVAILALLAASPLPLVLALVLLVATATGAVHGFVTERVVFRPLRHARSQAPLIATVGLAILLQEYLRLTQGAGDRWIQPVFSAPHALAAGDG
ncbi:MAG: ABC transporter permease subunit, partial [Geminicoccales bacterium]